ncbi:MAG: carboxypeptidase-like regulatory domain-containing protein [Terriglobales bacterium]
MAPWTASGIGSESKSEAENLKAYCEWDVQVRASAVMAVGARLVVFLGIFFAFSAFLCAQTLTGKVHNGTTGKPAAGDRVVLITPGQAMEEVARTRADASGHFSFRLPDSGPYLIRTVHKGVTYDRMAPPGTNSVTVQVFDVSRRVEGITVTADVMRLQAQGGELQGTRLFAVNNASKPPRTQTHGANFEFFLPDGAVIDQGMATTAGGQPVNLSPARERDKSRYEFVFPLRPGETEFQVVFHLEYRGELSIDPRALYGAEHFVVMVPKTMRFAAAPSVVFQAMEDPRQSDALVRVMSNTRAGQPLAFSISGTGTLNDPGDDSLGPPHAVGNEPVASPARDSGKGGGLSSALTAPGGRERFRWYVIGGIFLLLAGAAVFAIRRRHSAAISHRSDLLLEQVKNDLFQLEVEHQQGRISRRQYKRARAALDQTLDRAIKRTSQK